MVTSIEFIDPKKLLPHPKNIEIYGADDIEDLIKDLRKNNVILEPLCVNQNNTIISGHRRWRACLAVDKTEVPIIRCNYDDESEEVLSLIRFNKHRIKNGQQVYNEDKTWEEETTQKAKGRQGTRTDLVTDISPNLDRSKPKQQRAVEERAEILGVKKTTLQTIEKIGKAADTGNTIAKDLLPQIGLPDSKITAHGAWQQIRKAETAEENKKKAVEWEQLRTKVLTNDNMAPKLYVAKAESLSEEIETESITIIITSPPYNLGHEKWPMGGTSSGTGERIGIGYTDHDDSMPEDQYQEWQLAVFKELYRVAKPGASFFYNHKVRQTKGTLIHPIQWIQHPDNPWILRQEIIWDRKSTHNHTSGLFWQEDERIYWMTKGKPNLPKSINKSSIWQYPGPSSGNWHPAPFNEELPKMLLDAIGTPGKDIVLDPFGGSMTTCAIAQEMGYKSIGVDISEDYIKQSRSQHAW